MRYSLSANLLLDHASALEQLAVASVSLLAVSWQSVIPSLGRKMPRLQPNEKGRLLGRRGEFELKVILPNGASLDAKLQDFLVGGGACSEIRLIDKFQILR